jgi:hypothetical protein
MDAAKDLSIGFHAVAHHPALAVRANRRERVDCALEAIEDVMFAGNDHFKRLVVFVFANFACSHTQTVRAPSPLRRCSLLFCEFVGEADSFPYSYSFSEVEIARESDSLDWSRS